MDWVEVEAKSIDIAISEGMKELGITDREYAEIEVLQEPESGLLNKIGFGGKPARVIVKKKPAKRRNRNRNQRRDGASRSNDQQGGSSGARSGGDGRGQRNQKAQNDSNKGENRGNSSRRSGSERGKGQGRLSNDRSSSRSSGAPTETKNKTDKEMIVTNEEQAEVVKTFLEGLLSSFGLEGIVTSGVEDNTIIADIQGEQTEALIGPTGSIMHAINEVTRTVVQRRTHESVRLRLDIAGFGAQRREALAIYAQRLGDQVKDEGAEIMLEPMNAGDRKVIHDAVSDIEGVNSYSEGDEPRRSVVLSPTE